MGLVESLVHLMRTGARGKSSRLAAQALRKGVVLGKGRASTSPPRPAGKGSA